MTRFYNFGVGCLCLISACSASRHSAGIEAETSTRFRDLDAVVVADRGDARPIQGTGYVAYPDEERRRSVEAAFVIAFLVDTAGRVEHETISFIGGARSAFFSEACQWLLSQRYVPVRRAGSLRRSLVVTELSFTLDHSGDPGEHRVIRAPRVNSERHRREFATMGVVAAAHELERHRHC